MNLHEHVLEKDMVQASKEYACFKECLKQISELMDEGRFETAKQRSVDMLKSLHELSKLNVEKTTRERHNAILEHMGIAGIHVAVIRGLHHDK